MASLLNFWWQGQPSRSIRQGILASLMASRTIGRFLSAQGDEKTNVFLNVFAKNRQNRMKDVILPVRQKKWRLDDEPNGIQFLYT
jgi:hypothetical protein